MRAHWQGHHFGCRPVDRQGLSAPFACAAVSLLVAEASGHQLIRSAQAQLSSMQKLLDRSAGLLLLMSVLMTCSAAY